MTTTRKQKCEEKQLYDRFKRLINNISHQKTWTWLRKANLKREPESLLIAVQDNAIRRNHIKARIDMTQQNSKCRLCSDRDQTINHIISECGKLAQKEYKARHDWVGKVIHWGRPEYWDESWRLEETCCHPNSSEKPSANTDVKNSRGVNNNNNNNEQATRGKLTVQLEEINQKVLAKEGRLKRYRQRVKLYRQNRTFQNDERKFYQQLGGSDTKTYQQPDIKETERFWTKIGNQRNITKMLNG